MPNGLKPLESLQDVSAWLRQYGIPLLLLVSRSDCAYCREVRNHYLLPLARSGNQQQLLIRELESDQLTTVRDLQGRRVAVAGFLKAMNVNFYPTVLFLDSALQPLADPLRGLDQAGFYGAYLAQRIEQASTAARWRHRAARREQ